MTPNTEPKSRPATDAEIEDFVCGAWHDQKCVHCGFEENEPCADSCPTQTWPRVVARIEQEREMRRELAEALKNLVTVNQDWNAAVEETIGRPPHWTDMYLDAGRAALARAAKMEADYAR